MLDIQSRLARFNLFVAEGRIIRGAWHGKDAQGRETACLIGAFGPDINSARNCPGKVMPQWLAHLTPDFTDSVSSDYFPEFVATFARAANRWGKLSPEQWDRALCKTMIATLNVVLPHDTAGVVQPVIALYERWLGGSRPSRDEWTTAAWAAAARAAATAAWAAAAARTAAAWAAANAVESAVWTATANATTARANATTARATAAWDTIAKACLAAIEDEIAQVRP